MRQFARVILIIFEVCVILFVLFAFFDPRGSDRIYFNIRVVAFIALLILFYLDGGKFKGFFANPHQSKLFDSLRATQLVRGSDFTALRAFQIEECEDEGSHYMIELADGSVLYLNGQYLDEYEPFEDGGQKNPRRFPCTEFTVLRNRQNGEALELVCGGDVLEPECIAPPFDEKDEKQGLIPEDGRIYTDRCYDRLKRERMKK